MGKLDNLEGRKFGRLLVLHRGKTSKNRAVYWVCKCDCGNIKEVSANGLRTGNTVSCGCYRKEHHAHTHGMTRTRLYNVWNDIKMRCYQEKNNNYSGYGGRGITMCDEWHYSFESFMKWAYENGYDENAPRGKCTIDRKDTNGNYEPSNCRWVDAKTQANNRRSTILYEYNGELHNITDWSEIVGIGRTTLQFRISNGWTMERALTEPVRVLKKHNRGE